jgi:diacylglycerol kinase (ATP)
VKAVGDSKTAHYYLTLDGNPVEADGVTCLIDNAGNMGIQGFQPARNISVSDGLLDVLLVGPQGMKKIISTGPSLFETPTSDAVIEHWQASQISIEVDPPQPVQVDGEMVGDTPITAAVLPGALSVIAPGPG